MSDVRNHPKALTSDDLARIEAEERARREIRRTLDEEEAALEHERKVREFTFGRFVGRMAIGFSLAVLTIVTLPVSLVIWFIVGVVWALVKYLRS